MNKIFAILNWKASRNVSEFIKGFSMIVLTLTKLLQKDVNFFWFKNDASLNELGCVLMQDGKLLKDYDLIIDYHRRKANVFVDALNWKSLFNLRVMSTRMTLQHDGSILAELRAKLIFLQRN
ncbi:reverse transcriptase [Gossypium australe]|uniref:Reverse transcriptase n=1 Tax=Gossypium australe TaxID=47621 RepID=A0A5B6WQV1_9ROSI|nr:reverse transcriptase [Gossypium australe]